YICSKSTLKSSQRKTSRKMSIRSATVQAPVNIAVIKYWGKIDEEQVLALNDSISCTLSVDELCATTTVAISNTFKEDRMWLNGEEKTIESNKRLVNLLRHVRGRCRQEWKDYKIHICSKNNFPTAAGLASSAAGYACLVFALGYVFEIEDRTELSILARLGSGSACRSIFGGFVQWISGTDSRSSFAQQIVPANHWPELRCVILIVSDKAKDTSSTSGMQQSVKTSTLIHYRASEIVPKRVADITKAILERDFNTFAMITMKDSNQFHAICQDTWPPIRYMNDISWSVVKLIHAYNQYYGTNRVAYTFDAGPNACLYMLDETVDEILAIINHFYPPSLANYEYLRGFFPTEQVEIPQNLLSHLEYKQDIQMGAFSGIISTKIGDGPRLICDSLLDGFGLPTQ
ncbi:diphosphomevalonate decarboxylase-like isoform X1, partial [Dinothrombium tinctorium]